MGCRRDGEGHAFNTKLITSKRCRTRKIYLLCRDSFEKNREDCEVLHGFVLLYWLTKLGKLEAKHTGSALSASFDPSVIIRRNIPKKTYQRSNASCFFICAPT